MCTIDSEDLARVWYSLVVQTCNHSRHSMLMDNWLLASNQQWPSMICPRSQTKQSLAERAHLGEKDLLEAALGPGRALKGVAPVHEGTVAHACAPSPLNRWQPADPPLPVLPGGSGSLKSNQSKAAMLLWTPDLLVSSWSKQIGFDSASVVHTVHSNDMCACA